MTWYNIMSLFSCMLHSEQEILQEEAQPHAVLADYKRYRNQMNLSFLFWRNCPSCWSSVWRLRFAFVVLILVISSRARSINAREFKRCSSSRDCRSIDDFKWPCCAGVCAETFGCLGGRCNTNSDCFIDELCCNNTCQRGSNCFEKACSLDTDCPSDEICCGGSCSGQCVDIGIFVPIIVGALVCFAFINCGICRRTTSVIQQHSNLENNRKTKVIFFKATCIPETNNDVPKSFSFTRGMTSSYQYKSPCYPSPAPLYVPESLDPLPCYAERKVTKPGGKVPALITSYGATGQTGLFLCPPHHRSISSPETEMSANCVDLRLQSSADLGFGNK